MAYETGIGGSSGSSWGAVQGANVYNQASALNQVSQESLASIAPRIINLSQQVQECSRNLECSFGIGTPATMDAGQAATAPTLMNQLLMIEQRLQECLFALENVNRHVNG